MTDSKYLYRGSEWIKKVNPDAQMSELGISVADLLGDVYEGIYHLQGTSQLEKVDWGNELFIKVRIWGGLSTWDFSRLTKLVVLCFARMIRLEIAPRSNTYLTLVFYRRNYRSGEDGRLIYDSIPYLSDVINNYHEEFGDPVSCWEKREKE